MEKVPNEMIGQGAGGQGAEHRKNSPELEGLSVRVSVSRRALAVDARPHSALSVFPYLFLPLVLHLWRLPPLAAFHQPSLCGAQLCHPQTLFKL